MDGLTDLFKDRRVGSRLCQGKSDWIGISQQSKTAKQDEGDEKEKKKKGRSRNRCNLCIGRSLQTGSVELPTRQMDSCTEL